MVTFGPSDDAIAAYDHSGQPLWTYATTDGVNDAWPVDLNGDGDSELVLGLNGGGGVVALDSSGGLLWSDQSIANVWTVTAMQDQGSSDTFTTSATGHVYVFSPAGERVTTLKAPCYATAVRVADQPVVGGTRGEDTVVATLDHSGWATIVSQRKADLDSLVAAARVPWVAVATRSGSVRVLDASDGSVLGSVTHGGRPPQLAWATAHQPPILLAASEQGLRAYGIRAPASNEGVAEGGVTAEEAEPRPLAATTCVAPASDGLVGLWESRDTSRGGIGHALEFRRDGTAVASTTVMVDDFYLLEGNTLFIGETVAPPKESGLKAEIAGDTLILTQSDGSSVTKERVRAGSSAANSILGTWRYLHYAGATAYERYTDDGLMSFRLPMSAYAGCYTVAGGELSTTAPKPVTRELEIRDDELVLKSVGREPFVYRRAAAGPWYPRDPDAIRSQALAAAAQQ